MKFTSSDLVVQNMLLTQVNKTTVRIDFVDVFSPEPLTAAILKNFTLDKLENLTQATGAAVDAGNVIFFGQKSIQESFDVFDANSKAGVLSHRSEWHRSP